MVAAWESVGGWGFPQLPLLTQRRRAKDDAPCGVWGASPTSFLHQHFRVASEQPAGMGASAAALDEGLQAKSKGQGSMSP